MRRFSPAYCTKQHGFFKYRPASLSSTSHAYFETFQVPTTARSTVRSVFGFLGGCAAATVMGTGFVLAEDRYIVVPAVSSVPTTTVIETQPLSSAKMLREELRKAFHDIAKHGGFYTNACDWGTYLFLLGGLFLVFVVGGAVAAGPVGAVGGFLLYSGLVFTFLPIPYRSLHDVWHSMSAEDQDRIVNDCLVTIMSGGLRRTKGIAVRGERWHERWASSA